MLKFTKKAAIRAALLVLLNYFIIYFLTILNSNVWFFTFSLK